MATARPLLHFAPARNWMNDPNGLVFHDGLYHLYFQHNPFGDQWGNMSWGHATSSDLQSWREHEVALMHAEGDAVFSGSVVIDALDSSGLGEGGAAPLVALYTSAADERQRQAVASSTDGGHTWVRRGVVLDRGTSDFRDPKVIRYDDHWILIAVEASDRQLHLFRSDDLLHWTPLSVFGPAGAPEGIWECPDLFPIGDRWVLTLSINPGHPSGGSGMQYLVGDFDGVAFTATSWGWLDHGHDFYAGVTFAGLDEPVMIGWLNNWSTAETTPTEPWRGMTALPRRLSLRGDVLVQHAAIELGAADLVLEDLALTPEGVVLPTSGSSLRIRARLDRACPDLVVAVRSSTDGSIGTDVSYRPGLLSVDRSASGDVESARALPFVSTASIAEGGGPVDLEIWVDTCSVEVFADGGAVTISEQVFPGDEDVAIRVSGADGATVPRLEVTVVAAQDRIRV